MARPGERRYKTPTEDLQTPPPDPMAMDAPATPDLSETPPVQRTRRGYKPPAGAPHPAPETSAPPEDEASEAAAEPPRPRAREWQPPPPAPEPAGPAFGEVFAESRFARPQFGPRATQFAIVVVLGVVLFAAVSYTSNARATQRMEDRATALAGEVEALQTEQAELVDELLYVQSDQYVVDWAHNEGRYVRPGESLGVLVIPPDAPTPQVVVAVTPAPPPPDAWEVWLELFFGR